MAIDQIVFLLLSFLCLSSIFLTIIYSVRNSNLRREVRRELQTIYKDIKYINKHYTKHFEVIDKTIQHDRKTIERLRRENDELKKVDYRANRLSQRS